MCPEVHSSVYTIRARKYRECTISSYKTYSESDDDARVEREEKRWNEIRKEGIETNVDGNDYIR